MEIPHTGFAQVNDDGAAILLDCIRENLWKSRRLLDLYCGSGTVSIALSDHLKKSLVSKFNLRPSSVPTQCRRNNVQGQWFAGKVEEALPEVQAGADSAILLDPPREGLHPKACQFFASQEADCLVYVACNPDPAERDRAILESGNWTMTDLWMVDMFPQTPHVECVGEFIYTPQQD